MHQNLLESLASAAFLLNADSQILAVNDSLLSLLGATTKQLREKPLTSLTSNNLTLRLTNLTSLTAELKTFVRAAGSLYTEDQNTGDPKTSDFYDPPVEIRQAEMRQIVELFDKNKNENCYYNLSCYLVALNVETNQTAPPAPGLLCLFGNEASHQEYERQVLSLSEKEKTAQQLQAFLTETQKAYRLSDFIAVGPVSQRIYAQTQTAIHASEANVLILGPIGSGREHLAKTIYFESLQGEADLSNMAPNSAVQNSTTSNADPNTEARLIRIEGNLLTKHTLERHLRTLSKKRPPNSVTVLLTEIQHISPELQTDLLQLIELSRRTLATLGLITPHHPDTHKNNLSKEEESSRSKHNKTTNPAKIIFHPIEEPKALKKEEHGVKTQIIAPTVNSPLHTPLTVELWNKLATIQIQIPRLVEKPAEIAPYTQRFLQLANQEHQHHVRTIATETLEMLQLYGWPGELEELRSVITEAHRKATTLTLKPADLPAVIHHAHHAAQFMPVEKIQLDLVAYLNKIETELIQRAMNKANNNKAKAARLLGMTRPKLYRRLIQLKLHEETASKTTSETTSEVTSKTSPEKPNHKSPSQKKKE